MFSKKPETGEVKSESIKDSIKQSIPAPAARAASAAGPSLIGPDLTVTGNMVSQGEIQVEGTIEGDVHCKLLIVGEQATVSGGIAADEVEVRGRVVGSIRGMQVVLAASSHVEGDIFHKSLGIEQGAFFEGKSRRSDDPISKALKPSAPPAPASVKAESKPVTTPASGVTRAAE